MVRVIQQSLFTVKRLRIRQLFRLHGWGFSSTGGLPETASLQSTLESQRSYLSNRTDEFARQANSKALVCVLLSGTPPVDSRWSQVDNQGRPSQQLSGYLMPKSELAIIFTRASVTSTFTNSDFAEISPLCVVSCSKCLCKFQTVQLTILRNLIHVACIILLCLP